MRARVLRRQDGLALPMALGMMMVLGISVAAILAFTESSQRSSARMNADQRAFSAAEAGVKTAIARLAGSTDPSVIAALPPATGSIDGATWSYTRSLSGLTWTITGTGTVPSPIAGAAPVTRTVTEQVQITLAQTPWEWAFAAAPPSCMTIRNNAIFTTPLYVNGNLCLSNNAQYRAPKLYVAGTLTNSGTVGTAAERLERATLIGGCTGGVPNPHPCTQTDNVWATTITQTPAPLEKPPVNLTDAYLTAKPGPKANCNVGTVPGGGFDAPGDTSMTPNRNRVLFDLTPFTPYSCEYRDPTTNALVGELKWTGGSGGMLTVNCIVYFDGDIRHAGTATYQGRGTIYASGKITFSINATLCGIADCSAGWDTYNNVLLMISGSIGYTDTYGIHLGNNSVFQGALYAVKGVYIDNNAKQWGPVIADSIYVDNNADQYKALVRLPPGAPGIEKTVQPVVGGWRG